MSGSPRAGGGAPGLSSPALASSPDGSIYDLGYQHYDGPRLGRAYAIRSLYTHGLAAAFGLGRSARSKVIPMGLFVIALVPAVIALGVAALAGDIVRPVRLDNYYSLIGTVMLLFCAAVAPELVGRDQRHHVLSIYFSRALERRDYALAKLAALLTAMLLIALVPEFVLYVGNALVRPDPVGYLRDHLNEPGPIVASALATSLLVASVALAIAAFTPRRAYATGGIVAGWFIADGIGSAVASVGATTSARYAVFLSPSLVSDGAIRWFFGTSGDRLLDAAAVPGYWYVAAVLLYSAVALAFVLRRYQGVAA